VASCHFAEDAAEVSTADLADIVRREALYQHVVQILDWCKRESNQILEHYSTSTRFT
jgi:hypothetical protein